MAKILLKLLLLLFTVVVAHAIHDPKYEGIKTKTYRRDPLIAQAFDEQQQQQPQYQHPNFHHSQNNYQTASVDATERLSLPQIHSNNNQYQPEHRRQQQPQGGSYLEQQQELPLYQRSNYDERHTSTTSQAPRPTRRDDAENAITEYYTGCPSQYTGQLPYAYDCRRFLNCWNGRGHIQTCAPGTVFNSETLECDRPDKVVCGTLGALGQNGQPPLALAGENNRAGRLINANTEIVETLCPLGATGLQPHPTDCTKFLNCANGNMHVQACGPGTAYSIAMMTCDFRHKVDCRGRGGEGMAETPSNSYASSRKIAADVSSSTSPSTSSPECVCPPSVVGLYPHPSDCTKFLNCVHGTTVVQDCGPGTAFDSVKLVCDFKEKVNCSSGMGRGVANSSPEANRKPKQEGFSNRNQTTTADILCPAGVTGLFVYPFDYTKFFNCKNGNTAIQNCVHGTVFSISKGFCDSKDTIIYTDRVTYIISELSYEYSKSVTFCPPGTDGIHLYPFDGVKYLKCISGQLNILECTAGTAFSISRKLCLPKQQVLITDRVKYITEIMQQITSTVSYAGNIARNNLPGVQCSGGVNGLYPFPFDSTKYVSCLNGKLTIETCTSGSVFSLSRKHCHLRENINANDRVLFHEETKEEWSLEESYGYTTYGLETTYLMCPQSKNGFFLHPFDCTKYLNCHDGLTVIESCASGAVFSISTRRCVSRNQVEAYDRVEYLSESQNEFSTEFDSNIIQSGALICPTSFEGLYPHRDSCTKYLKCTNGRTSVKNCAAGMVFSITKRYCDYEDKISATDRSTYNQSNNTKTVNTVYTSKKTGFSNVNTGEICTAHASGMYPHPEDCTKFINCDNTVAHIQSCGPGTAWSIEMEVCDFSEKVDCTGRSGLASDFGTGSENAVAHKTIQGSTIQKVACPDKANGLYPHPFDYNKYFSCQAGNSILQICQVGSIFSISRRVCAAQGEVSSTDHVEFVREYITKSNDFLNESMEYIICLPTNTGYYIYPFDCEKFIKCEHDRTFVEDCPPGTVFSISNKRCTLQNQVLRSDRVWFLTETLQDTGYVYSDTRIICPPGVTGLYQHPYDCKKFLNCINDQTLIEECSPGRVFSLSKKFCELDVNVAASDRSNNGVIYTEYDYNYAKTPTTSSANGVLTPTCPPNANSMHPHPYDCTKFINCANGLNHIQDCAPGTAWNTLTKLCDFKDKVDCSDRESLRVGNESKSYEWDSKGGENAKMSCPAGVSGIQPHPFDCTKFINCANGVAHIQECAPGTAWNIAMEACDFVSNVDCSSRQRTALHSTQTDYSYSNNNRDSKSYPNEGSSQTNPGDYYPEDNRHNPGQNLPDANPHYHHQNWQNNKPPEQHSQTRNPGHGDRWTNMNMPRPDANLNGQTQYGETNRNTETEPTWSGVGSSINRQSPSTSVLYVEGSLQPDNYGNTIKTYSAPLAPFSQNNGADSLTTTTTSRTNTNIYYAQPVGSQEDSQETFPSTSPGTRPNLSRNPSVNAPNWPNYRQNQSREINYSSTVNSWTPALHSPAPVPQSPFVPIPNQNFMPPYPSTPQRPQATYPNRLPLNTPVTHLMPPPHSDRGQRPQEEPEFGVAKIYLDRLPSDGQFDISAYDQYPSGRNPTPNMPIDSSNLYGGLRPPLPPLSSSTPTNPTEHRYHNFSPAYPATQNPPQPVDEERQHPSYTPQQPNTTPRTYLYPPTKPTDSTNKYDGQGYPTILNATVQTFSDPHYSPPYSGVAHSRNTTWPNIGRKVPSHSSGAPGYSGGSGYSGDVNSNPYQPDYDDDFLPTTTTTESRAVLPSTYNRQYYPPTVPLEVNEETTIDAANMNDLPISDALRMLLRPYFNRSGTVSENTAGQAESHIMNLVAQAKDTSAPTTATPTTTTSTTTFRPTTIHDIEDDDDVELIIAGEQHSLINIPNQSGTHETKNDFHTNQKNLTSPKSNRQTHEHSRDFHLRHPHLPNPFPEAERTSVNLNSNGNTHKHHQHHHPHMHMQHNREFHLRHPKMPNPFGGTREGDKSILDKDILDTPNPYAESTTTPTTLYNADIDIRIDNKGSQFDCGNGKSVKAFEVCDGVNNCGNRKDESHCEHLGYEVRLTGGESPHVGRVEVKILGKWGYVCDDKFGLRDADVVCKELGFPLGANEVRGNSFYPPADVNFPFVMDEVDCRGNETSLRDCDFKGWGVNNCGPDEVVGVVCKVPLYKCPNNHWLCSTSKECIPTNFVCDNTPDCQDKSDESDKICNSPVEYRLEGGRSVNEGRLEVMYRGEWGTVCDDDFGLREAQVVCNSLGYYGEPKIEKNIFGLGSGPIWLDQVSCFGNETSIDKCNHWTWGEHNCNHTEDVGLKCTAGPPPRRLAKNGRTILTPSSAEDNQQAIQEGKTSLEDIGLYPGQWERSSKFVNNQRRCGHFKTDLTDEYEHPEERVVNGTIARRGHHPWQATIRTRGRGGVSGHWCGAVLISKKHLLTAAHCLAGYPKGAYFIRMGDHYANIAESSEIDSYIENWYLHEKFRDKTHMNNDIALIVLKNPVRFNDYIQPICLPEKGAPLKENRMCTISGWGSIKSGVSTPSNILRAAQLPILKDDTCKQAHVYGASVTEGMFCAGTMDESVDACDGDSGGPLVCSDEDGETLYGIISWGQQCGYANKPGVYVRVEKYIDWIFEKINFSIQQTGRH